MELYEINNFMEESNSGKMRILQGLFSTEYVELEITQLVRLSEYVSLLGYEVPNTTPSMFSVFECLVSAGAVETMDSLDGKLMVRIKQ